MKRHLSIVCLLVLTTFLPLLDSESATADPIGWVTTYLPSARRVAIGVNGWVDDITQSKIPDSTWQGVSTMHGEDQLEKFIATNDFTNPDAGSFWIAQPIIPDDATIVWIELAVRFKLAQEALATFILEYALNTTYDEVRTETASWEQGSNLSMTATGYSYMHGPYWREQIRFSNVTSCENWTPAMVKSNSTWVRIRSVFNASEDNIYVDYVGLEYVWTLGTWGGWGGGGSGGEDPIPFSLGLSVTGLLGLAGFIGMIMTIPGSIYFYRRDRGSKIVAVVTALGTFVVCFALFMGSISG